MEPGTLVQKFGDQIHISIQMMDQFRFELHRAIIILENGAAFAYGQLQEFQGQTNVAESGFIELTDTNKLKPMFIDDLRGELSEEEGQFGIFGTFQLMQNSLEERKQSISIIMFGMHMQLRQVV
ncbi:MAG: hypothetical protein EZS28_009513 [Streblomastix strix]|uniref:Uncharacterized protein n=1 Tax=Streblomastix strix TaxID=222440 RepID=A0A5J4WIQ8_9EUKA|nr:MAG: hypothetical protein EZS28_009513 [Streblomastix strix]